MIFFPPIQKPAPKTDNLRFLLRSGTKFHYDATSELEQIPRVEDVLLLCGFAHESVWYKSSPPGSNYQVNSKLIANDIGDELKVHVREQDLERFVARVILCMVPDSAQCLTEVGWIEALRKAGHRIPHDFGAMSEDQKRELCPCESCHEQPREDLIPCGDIDHNELLNALYKER